MTKYKINKGLIVQKLDKKTVIFDSDKSVLYTFNETASEIFRWLKKGLDKKEIVAKIVKKYRVKEDKVKNDFDQLIGDLLKKKILSFAKPKKSSRRLAG